MDLIVLPGLDGTALMLAEFKSASLANFSSVILVSYPTDRVLDYSALELIARAALPKDRPFVLLGESFSGPIALSIAANPPPGLTALVLCATFASCPVALLKPFARLTRFAPVRALSVAALSWFLLGRWATSKLIADLQKALDSVAPAVLRARMAQVFSVDVWGCLKQISVPVLYLRAAQDRLISTRAGNKILSAIPQALKVDIAGPHLLLQAAPVACAKAVADFANELN